MQAMLQQPRRVWVLLLLLLCMVPYLRLNAQNTSTTMTILSERPAMKQPKHDGITWVPLPYEVSHWSEGGKQFYHTSQCLWTAFAAAKVDPVLAAHHPEQFAFCAFREENLRFKSKSLVSRTEAFARKKSPFTKAKPPLIESFETAFWNVSDDYYYDECVQENNGTFTTAFFNRAYNTDSSCRVYDSKATMEWYHQFLSAKLNISEGEPNVRTNCDTNNNASSAQQLPRIAKALFVNRPHNRHVPLAMVEQTIKNRTRPGEMTTVWTYIPDLSELSILQQDHAFLSHDLIVIPHGAGEANSMALTHWDQHRLHRLPSTVVEICPAYSHCECINVCPGFYKDRWNNLAFFGIAFENPDMNCTDYCSSGYANLGRVKNNNITSKEIVPDFGLVIDSLIETEIRPLLSRYCRKGDAFDLQEELRNTTITILYSYNISIPQPPKKSNAIVGGLLGIAILAIIFWMKQQPKTPRSSADVVGVLEPDGSSAFGKLDDVSLAPNSNNGGGGVSIDEGFASARIIL